MFSIIFDHSNQAEFQGKEKVRNPLLRAHLTFLNSRKPEIRPLESQRIWSADGHVRPGGSDDPRSPRRASPLSEKCGAPTAAPEAGALPETNPHPLSIARKTTHRRPQKQRGTSLLKCLFCLAGAMARKDKLRETDRDGLQTGISQLLAKLLVGELLRAAIAEDNVASGIVQIGAVARLWVQDLPNGRNGERSHDGTGYIGSEARSCDVAISR